jgi:hypothetical protein
MQEDSSLWHTSAKYAGGTVRWQSRELLLEEQARVNAASDMWAFGMTIFVSLSSSSHFTKHETIFILGNSVRQSPFS